MRSTCSLLIVLAVAGCAPAAPPSGSVPEVATTHPSSPAPTRTTEPPPAATPLATSPTEAAWTPLVASDASPAAREDHTWTVDSTGSTAWLFGGRDGATVFDDLWAFDLATDRWRAVTPANAGPEARFGHEAAWVEGVGLVVFAGQAGPTEFYNDLWAFDPATRVWRVLPPGEAVPVARYGSCSAVASDGRLWISHGFTQDGTRFADTWAYDFTAQAWARQTIEGPRPVARCLHGCWFSPTGDFMLYAGQTTGVDALGDLWTLTAPGTPAAAWTEVAGAAPAERKLYAFAVHGDDVIVFGGGGPGGVARNDVWRFSEGKAAPEPVALAGEPPTGRWGATLIADPGRGRLVLFGGRDGAGTFDDSWALTIP